MAVDLSRPASQPTRNTAHPSVAADAAGKPAAPKPAPAGQQKQPQK